MNATFARPARRLAATLAAAGIAALGSVALAPAASAASLDGPSHVIEGPGIGEGPGAFIVSDRGRTAVFFCDPQRPNRLKDTCIVPDSGTRF